MNFTAADTSDEILANFQGPTLHYNILMPLRYSSVYYMYIVQTSFMYMNLYTYKL